MLSDPAQTIPISSDPVYTVRVFQSLNKTSSHRVLENVDFVRACMKSIHSSNAEKVRILSISVRVYPYDFNQFWRFWAAVKS